ncbi:MAG: hypothetical protein AAFY28_04040, partial [Actinomycetota bacterium]
QTDGPSHISECFIHGASTWVAAPRPGAACCFSASGVGAAATAGTEMQRPRRPAIIAIAAPLAVARCRKI